jgi:hypothetical protein
MKTKTCLFVFFIILFTSTIQSAPPFDRGMEDMSMGKPPIMRILENLDVLEEELKLSDQQISAIEMVNLKHEKKHLTYAETLIPSHIKVKKLTLEKPINYKEIRSILESTSETMVNMRIDSIKHMEEIKAQLTSKQRLKLKRLNKKRMFRRMPFMNKGKEKRK